jgi:uncharacterized protein (DUF885 family)
MTCSRRSVRVLAGTLALACGGVALLVTLAVQACAATPSTSGSSTRGEDRPAAPSTDGATMREIVERFDADRASIERFWDVESSPERARRLRRFHDDTLAELARVPFDELDVEGKVDWVLLERHVKSAIAKADVHARELDEIAALIPFANDIAALQEARRALADVDPEPTAAKLDEIARKVADARKDSESKKADIAKPRALRAANVVGELSGTLRDWHGYRAGYDAEFTWWTRKPEEALEAALDGYRKFLREDVAGIKPGDETTIVGDPIGRDALLVELEREMIPYTPEELRTIADKELEWCTARMLEASRAAGFGDDWKKALEKVKEDHVAPGKQPDLVRDLARAAVQFVKEKDLVSVPPLAEETWRMQMMSPEAQLRNPFFLGGESILVAFPTDAMTNEQKRMSMRGNNVHFAHATVFHELIPGHRLQSYYESRFRPYRRVFSTPFWTEGWALYWEMLLWDEGFQTTPEDRIGALFWRMHRCARIHFSLGFHLGEMTPDQCIDYLVDKVGHERDNAAAEVRRSFAGGYSPLYQCAYMIGGLQIRALHRELVGSGKMKDRAFHDAILEGNCIPIEMVRARFGLEPLTREFKASWRFYELGK